MAAGILRYANPENRASPRLRQHHRERRHSQHRFRPGLPPAGAEAIVLTDQLADRGVLFSSPDNIDIAWLGNSTGWEPSQYSIIPFNDPSGTRNAFPIRIDFLDPVYEVSIRAFDGGGDIDEVFLEAYDSAGQLIALDESDSSHENPGETLSVSITGIDYVIVRPNHGRSNRGVFLDDLSFTTGIPAPGTALIAAIGLLTSRRNRRSGLTE